MSDVAILFCTAIKKKTRNLSWCEKSVAESSDYIIGEDISNPPKNIRKYPILSQKSHLSQPTFINDLAIIVFNRKY